MRATLLAALTSLATACHSGKVEEVEPAPKNPPSEGPAAEGPVAVAEPEIFAEGQIAEVPEEGFEAVLEIDAKPGGKRFQGVWLDRGEDQRLVVDYRAREFWRPFENKSVVVTGEPYSPRGQAIMAPHFRVHTLRVKDAERAANVVALGAEQTLIGEFKEQRGPKGSKSEGEQWLVFHDEGGASWEVVHAPQNAEPGRSFEIRARKWEMSPHAAHRPGDHLWVIDAQDR